MKGGVLLYIERGVASEGRGVAVVYREGCCQ